MKDGKAMEPRDRNYLQLQFRNKVYKYNGIEFQSFFENIMESAYSDFQKIRPCGNRGDGGNDGFRPSIGAYYQVYAPKNPNEKDTKAVSKLKEDFGKLHAKWDKIAEVKIYYFVFNDKWGGSTIVLEEALAELKTEHPNIEFELFTPKSLENIFFDLKNENILALGFDIDTTKAISIIHEYLGNIETDLDRENATSALKALENIKDILFGLEDESLQFKYELIEARVLQKLERTEEAIKRYENLCSRYPNDPWAYLYLAEYYLNIEDFETNEKMLKMAEEKDSNNWLLALEKLIRAMRLNDDIDISTIDENSFPTNPRIKSNYYRLYAYVLSQAGEFDRAKSFIERAITLNPNRIHNYDAKLTITENILFSEKSKDDNFQACLEQHISEIDSLQEMTRNYGGLTPRIQSMLNLRKLSSLKYLELPSRIGTLAKDSFEALLQCYFDQTIDSLFVILLTHTELPTDSMKRFQDYLECAKKDISVALSRAILFQFCLKGTLVSEGYAYFSKIDKADIVEFIGDLKAGKYEKACDFVITDTQFAIMIANSAKEFPELRKLIIEKLPSDGTIQKDKLLLLLNYDEDRLDEAFELLKNYDLSNLHYFECKAILDIAWAKGAWEFVINVIDRFLEYEQVDKNRLQLKLQKFTACQNLGQFKEVIRIGELVLSNNTEMELLDDLNKENVLAQTMIAKLKRGNSEEAETLLTKHSDLNLSFEFKIGIEVEVLLKNRKPEKVLNTIVEGCKLLGSPSPEQYGSLFFAFSMISNMIDFKIDSLDQVCDDCFVKLKDQERWYYIGDQCELDASKISSSNATYQVYLGKSINDKLDFGNRYSSQRSVFIIELVLPIEKYIAWQCRYQATKLSRENRWDMMKMIEVPTTDDKPDPQHLIAFLEDQTNSRGDFFKLYCDNNLPLAFLAVSQGGLAGAISTIVNENKGFIKCTSGGLAEVNRQKEVAVHIIDGNEFYIDGTSALMLSETGMLEKIYEFIPNLRIPQSVITMLLEIREKFEFTPGLVGHMGYAQGKMHLSEINQDKGKHVKLNFERSIALLESKKDSIKAISSAFKCDCASEKMVPPELSDACILAQNHDTMILTEDFLYLQANEHETKKKAPDYSSTFALVKTLCELKKITFKQYLEYFCYLSSYRCRFLPITTEDLETAVFGPKELSIVNPEAIWLFNFPLTLSLEYGVVFDQAFQVVGQFILKMLVDDSITIDTAERVFNEILSSFPTDKNKGMLGRQFLQVSVNTINNRDAGIIIGSFTKKKIDVLAQFASIYDGNRIIHRF
ncbi:MAG: tetratricopeptide repeat protein [Candidatus Kariarchaeaceae archaeon]